MAITYGMSVKEFWEDSPDLFWAYRFSFYQKLKREQEMANYNAWLQGGYICEAVCVAINNCFAKKKIEYSKYPYGSEIQKQQNDPKKQQEALVAMLKNRVNQVQAIKGQKESSTTDRGNTEGGENINGQ